MAIPKHDEIRVPALQLLQKQGMMKLKDDNFLKSQIATSSSNWGGRRKPPLVFTEHGALQAANVLNSDQASRMSVFIIRAFVQLREMAFTNEILSRKFEQLEERVTQHDNFMLALVKEIRNLIDSPKTINGKQIGFRIPEKREI